MNVVAMRPAPYKENRDHFADFLRGSADYDRLREARMKEPGRIRVPTIPVSVLEDGLAAGVELSRIAQKLGITLAAAKNACRKAGLDWDRLADRQARLKDRKEDLHGRLINTIMVMCEKDYRTAEALYAMWKPVDIADLADMTVKQARMSWPDFSEFEAALIEMRRKQGYTVEGTARKIKEQADLIASMPPAPHDCFERLLDGEDPSTIFAAPEDDAVEVEASIVEEVTPPSSDLAERVAEMLYGHDLVPGTYTDETDIERCDRFEGKGADAKPMIFKYRSELDTVRQIIELCDIVKASNLLKAGK